MGLREALRCRVVKIADAEFALLAGVPQIAQLMAQGHILPRNPSRRASQDAPDKAAISAIGAMKASPTRRATRLAIAPSCRKHRKVATEAEVTQQMLARDTFLSDTTPPIANSLVQPGRRPIVSRSPTANPPQYIVSKCI
jgi:hypothetical protein